jgi:hypothetical protein
MQQSEEPMAVRAEFLSGRQKSFYIDFIVPELGDPSLTDSSLWTVAMLRLHMVSDLT